MLKIFLVLSCLYYIYAQQGAVVPHQRPLVYIAPPQSLKELHFGYNESVADSLWIRYIQDMESCGESSLSSSVTSNKEKRCIKGWSFRILDAVTTLAPKFRMPHAVGGTNLTVLNNDQQGAEVIFERGIKNFNTDWPILYRAAYFYLYEVKNNLKAAQLLDQAGAQGAPIWVSSLAARIWSKEGQLELGIRSLKEYQSQLWSPQQKQEVQKRIEVLIAERQKLAK